MGDLSLSMRVRFTSIAVAERATPAALVGQRKLGGTTDDCPLDPPPGRLPIAFLDQERRSAMVPRHWTIVDIAPQNTALYSPNGSIAQYCGEIELGEPMLAAVPSEADKRLELFRLALLLNSKNKTALPPALEAYFNAVLSQARLLILDPDRISGLQTPQAIQLANEMRSNERLRELLDGIDKLDGISGELAARALSTLEPDLASAD